MKISLRWPFPAFPKSRAQNQAEIAPRRTLPCSAIRWVGPLYNIAIRQFEWPTDIEKICEWQRETYAINFPHFKVTRDFSHAFRQDLRRALLDSNHALWVLDDAPSGGDVCGFLWVVLCHNQWTGERYGYVNNLFIAPEKRGQHLAHELLKHGEVWFKSRRVQRLRLTVTATNASAMRLYQRAGFETERFEMEKEIL